VRTAPLRTPPHLRPLLLAIGFQGAFLLAATLALVSLAFAFRFAELRVLDRAALEGYRR
jgi:hypothetical protein